MRRTPSAIAIESFTGIPDVHESASIEAAIAQAAHDTLVELFPSQRIHCDQVLEADLNAIPNSAEKTHGINTGRKAARTVLTLAAQDGSNRPEPRVGIEYIPGTQPGEWRPDPISNLPLALGAYWGEVRPMVIQSAAAVPRPAAAGPELEPPTRRHTTRSNSWAATA